MCNHTREEGQGIVEYAIILALVAIVVIFALAGFGSEVAGLYERIVVSFPGGTHAGSSEHALEPGRPGATPTTPPPPGPVAVISPTEGESVTSPVTFRWVHVPGATEYEVWIDGGNGKLPANASVCNLGQCSRTVPLSPGEHKWRIRAISNGQNGSPTPWIEFTVIP